MINEFWFFTTIIIIICSFSFDLNILRGGSIYIFILVVANSIYPFSARENRERKYKKKYSILIHNSSLLGYQIFFLLNDRFHSIFLFELNFFHSFKFILILFFLDGGKDNFFIGPILLTNFFSSQNGWLFYSTEQKKKIFLKKFPFQQKDDSCLILFFLGNFFHYTVVEFSKKKFHLFEI